MNNVDFDGRLLHFERNPMSASLSPLLDFHPVVRAWFERTYHEPSPPQMLGWPSIAAGRHTLILAPTGSGKTLAAFLWAINHLVEERLAGEPASGVRILYVSPLKALNNDIHRNLEEPLAGIQAEARLQALHLPPITTAVRTGDTPASKRASMLRKPPDILITTPESLYLMLTSPRARGIFRTVHYVIVDEIHSVCGNKRGVHLSLSLERLARVAEQEFIRIGLSATQRPLDLIARYLGGVDRSTGRPEPRPVAIIDAGQKKQMDLRVECAAPDFSLLSPEGIWPLVFREMLENIRRHRTTLVFVNNRRLAERIAAKLNEMILGTGQTFGLYAVPHSTGATLESNPGIEAGTPIPVQAYHGSMSREARERMEDDLKAGRLSVLVATSSLELGIDIGSIDLVIQVQSPKGIGRGLQRVGRSGHLVTAGSKGRIYPTHREDLVESAVVARAMTLHDVEPVNIPENCLDVLAQQIVAMVSVEEWDAEELYTLVRQSYCYRELPSDLYGSVLQMLAGRYAHEAFRDLRARISWDRVNNTLRALPGSNHLAITSGGTIADRGYFGVYLEDGRTRVGEVDEEFILESRVGDTFILGSSVWRMIAIDANRLTVVAAPGQPARMPFWRGEGIGRSFEVGRQIGEFRRTIGARLDTPGCTEQIQQAYPVDGRSAWNIVEHLRRQREATGMVPNDRLILIEGFRDEIGDPRIIIHSCFGRRVNALLGLVLARRLENRVAVEPQMLYNDDGILLRCSDVDTLPLDLLEGLTPGEASEIILTDILSSPLFGGQFRQNASRALLMPRAAPGRRTPLWLQRLRAADLLQVARQVDDFPIVVETIRDVLQDVLDYTHLQAVVRDIAGGSISVRTVQTDFPSPFATGLLFDFIAVYMYEWDQPRSDRLTQFVSINREVLSGILNIDTIRSLVRPEAVTAVESRLQHTAEGTQARSPEELLEILLRVGDLTDSELSDRCAGLAPHIVEDLARNGRAIRMEVGGEARWVAGEERILYTDPGTHAPVLLRRYLQTHGPVGTARLASRFGLAADRVEQVLTQLSEREPISRRPGSGDQAGGVEADWFYRPTMERIQRSTLQILRKEIRPSPIDGYTRFLFRWQHLSPGTQFEGRTGLAACLEQMQGLPLPSETWEREILLRRVRGYSSPALQEVCASGAFVWTGSGQGKLRITTRGEGAVFLPPSSTENEMPLRPSARRILESVSRHGASFFGDLRTDTHLSLTALNDGIAELVWNGLLTNDRFDELLQVGRPSRTPREAGIDTIAFIRPYHDPDRVRLMRSARKAIRSVPGWNGRWSPVHVPGVMGEPLSTEERAELQARQLLDRYGILPREFCRREEILPWPLLAAVLQGMELRGEIRRGYFVEGLSGMQYALPEAVEELRAGSAPVGGGRLTLLAACDPANPFGVGVGLPGIAPAAVGRTISRIPSTYLVFSNGLPIAVIEGYGARLDVLGDPPPADLAEGLTLLTDLLRLSPEHRPFRGIVIEHCNELRATASPLEPLLRSLGFRADRNQTMRFDGYP
jgi:ATP-dependent helicase Lhr and Lhr-like helicase